MRRLACAVGALRVVAWDRVEGASDTQVSGAEETQAGDGPRARTVSSDTVPSPGTAIGRYVVLGLVGHGGMGVVLAAYDPQLDRKVALKLVRPGRAADAGEIEREARLIARVRHPNLVTVHDVGHAEGGVFLAMEFVEGASLREHQRARRTWRELVAIYLQAARGLASVHEVGVVHGDFKPDNVRVGTAGGRLEAKLLDFGLAHSVAVEGIAPRGEPWTPPGTVAYMAPERLAGRPASPQTDQFAFCVALFEALAGRRPFDLEALATAGAAAPTWPRNERVPAWLRRAVDRGLAFAPAERWPSMHALALALERGPGRARRRGFALALTAATGLTIAVAATRPDACAEADAPVRAAWTPQRAARAEEVLASAAGERTRPEIAIARIDAYADALRRAAVRSCDATRSGDTILEARRRRCVDVGLSKLDAWAALLTDPDPARSSAAQADVLASSPYLVCEDDAALLRQPDPPRPADELLAKEHLRRLAELQVLRYWSAHDHFEADLDGLVAEVRANGDAIALSEALVMQGWATSRRGNLDDGYAQLLESLRWAESSGATWQQAEAWRGIAENRNAHVDGAAIQALAAERARAAVERLGDPPELSAQVQNALAGAQSRAGDTSSANATLEVAIAAAERADATGVLVEALVAQVITLLRADRIEDAVRAGERAVALSEGLFAEGPEAATAMGALAAALSAARRFDDAEALSREALRRLDRWGPMTVMTAGGIACNWCYGVDAACDAARIPDACSACVRAGLLPASPSPSLAAGFSNGLLALARVDRAAALAFADEIASRPVEAGTWRRPIAAAASIFADTDPARALDLVTRLCAHHGEQDCGEDAQFLRARLDGDPSARARAREVLRGIWARLSRDERAESLPLGVLLAEHGLVPRAEVAAARPLAVSCAPGLAEVDAWLADADGPAAGAAPDGAISTSAAASTGR